MVNTPAGVRHVLTLDITDMKRMQQEVQAQRDFARQVAERYHTDHRLGTR